MEHQGILRAGAPRPQKITGLSGNEIFCLNRLGMGAGNLCVGNSVFSLGFTRSLSSGLRVFTGGEIPEITEVIHEGRERALHRMMEEAGRQGGDGITGVTSELVHHGTNIEFLSIGSTVHGPGPAPSNRGAQFSTSASAQELYCQMDSGFEPKRFVFGNVAYSIGLGGNLRGMIRGLSRGEVNEFSEVFDKTRHLALTRLTDEAKACGANSVIGIQTTLTPFMGAQEMLMLGTAANHPLLKNFASNPVTSDLTHEELWNIVHLGYLPLRLVMGVSVYSIGLAGGLLAAFKSIGRGGEIENMTSLIYEAREKALDRIERDARKWGADQVVGVKTHIYDLGGGLIEFLAIGTAVKKVDGLTTKSPELLPQAIIRDQDTYFERPGGGARPEMREMASARVMQRSPLVIFAVLILFALRFLW